MNGETELPPRVFEAAKQHHAAERAALQKKIREQRLELKRLSRAHGTCHVDRENLLLKLTDLHVRLAEAGRRQARVGEALREAKRWGLDEYFKFLQGLGA